METQGVSLLSEEYRIWQKYSHYIFNLCFRKCRDLDAARDFYQEIYIKFHHHSQKVVNHPCPGFWFRSVINNAWNSALRKQLRCLPINNLYCCDNRLSYFAEDEDFSRILEELNKNVALTSLEKMLLEYRFVGFSFLELSEILGIGVKTLRKKVVCAQQKLMSLEKAV